MTTTTSPPDRALWTGLLLAPAAWSVHGLLGWFIGHRVCTGLMPAAARLAVAAMTVAALLFSMWAVAVAWRSWQAARSAPSPLATDAGGRVEFMALAGLMVSSVFTLGIFWAGWATLFLNDCGWMR
jgi:hypothetical protein